MPKVYAFWSGGLQFSNWCLIAGDADKLWRIHSNVLERYDYEFDEASGHIYPSDCIRPDKAEFRNLLWRVLKLKNLGSLTNDRGGMDWVGEFSFPEPDDSTNTTSSSSTATTNKGDEQSVAGVRKRQSDPDAGDDKTVVSKKPRKGKEKFIVVSKDMKEIKVSEATFAKLSSADPETLTDDPHKLDVCDGSAKALKALIAFMEKGEFDVKCNRRQMGMLEELLELAHTYGLKELQKKVFESVGKLIGGYRLNAATLPRGLNNRM